MPLPTWAGPQDAAGYELRNVLVELVNGLPAATGNKGRILYDTQTDRFWYSNGTTWVNKATDSDALQGQNGAYYLNLANANGQLAVANVSGVQGVINATRLDQLSAPTADVPMGGRKLTGLADGISGQDAATYGQLLQLINNQVFKTPVRAATTANITLSGLQTIDGVTLVTNDRVLVKDQSAGGANGIYVAASGAWTRATDADTSNEMPPGLVVGAQEGSANGDKLFMMITNGPITVGTTALSFIAYGASSGEIGVGGAGLVKTGATYDVVAGTGISVNPDSVQLNRTAGDGVLRGSLITEGIITGASGADVTITHNLGTKYPVIKVFDITAVPEREVQTGMQPVSTTTSTLSFGAQPANNRYRWTATG